MKTFLIIDAHDVTTAVGGKLLQYLNENGIKHSIKQSPEGKCPMCGFVPSTEQRTVSLFAEMVVALGKVFDYCRKKGSYEFTRKEVKFDILAPLGENVTARFGDWKLFGGLIYTPADKKGKEKKGNYAFNVSRTEEFLSNRLRIPTKIVLQQGKEPVMSDFRLISETPKLASLLDSSGKYISY